MRIAAPAFFCLPFAWNIFFYPLTFSLYVSLGMKSEKLDSLSRCKADAISQFFVSWNKSITSGHWILFIPSNIHHFWGSVNVKFISSGDTIISLFTGAEIIT